VEKTNVMKKFLLATIAIISLGTASGNAADLPVKAPPMVAPMAAYNWTGLYLGAHVGGAFPGSNFFGNDDARLMAGVQIGADYQFASNWVTGLEANYSFVDSRDSGVNFFANRNLGSVTGRLGYTWGPALLYAKGGFAWADTRRSFGFTSNGENGYTIGGGLEYMLAPSWSAKLEYQYYNFGDVTFASAPPVVLTTFRNDEHTIKLGLNYRFNFAGMPATRGY
jgi:outer membrane immunogenic protein